MVAARTSTSAANAALHQYAELLTTFAAFDERTVSLFIFQLFR